MGTAADIFQLTGSAPVWLSVSLVVLALLGRGVLARTASAKRQGRRIGQLELAMRSERTRRRQVEAELIRLGVPLPYWPEDPLPMQLRRPPARDQPEDVDDPVDDEPPTAAAPRVPVPPLPPEVGARHRREPARNQGDY